MSRLFNRRNVLIVVTAIVVSPTIWWITAGVRGQVVARYDVAVGHYKILQYGLPSLGFSEYRALLLRRYGIDVQPKGCVITDNKWPILKSIQPSSRFCGQQEVRARCVQGVLGRCNDGKDEAPKG